MSFANEYLGQLQVFAAAATLPRVRALHLPPEVSSDGSKGEFCALELEDGSIGLSYVLLDDILERLRRGDETLALPGADALAVAGLYAGSDRVAKTIGFAAANAISRCLYDRAGFRPERATDSIGQIDPQPGEHIGMIGYFRPLLGRVLHSGARLTVVELKAELVGEREGHRVTVDPEELMDCSKVLSTSTLLLNDSLDRMLGYCRNARWFAMIGPSAGCLPDALFSRGVTLLGGNWVSERLGFIAALSAGESFSPHAYKFALTPEAYPGFAALLARAR